MHVYIMYIYIIDIKYFFYLSSFCLSNYHLSSIFLIVKCLGLISLTGCLERHWLGRTLNHWARTQVEHLRASPSLCIITSESFCLSLPLP